MNPRFLVEEVGGMGCVEGRESDGLMILYVCCGSPVRRISSLLSTLSISAVFMANKLIY